MTESSLKSQQVLSRIGFCFTILMQVGFSISITPPKTWLPPLSLPQGIILQYAAPIVKDGFTMNVNVMRRPMDSTLADVKTVKQLLSRLESEQSRIFPMFKVLEKSEKTIGKTKGAFLFSQYAYGSLDLAAYQFVCIKNNEIISVAFTCLTSQINLMKPEFEKSLLTFRPD